MPVGEPAQGLLKSIKSPVILPLFSRIPMTYTVTDAEQIQENLKSHFPAVSANLSTLGGPDKASIIIKLSLDQKETWINGIFQNSRFSMFSLNENKLEQFAKHYQLSKFRKSTIKSNDDVVTKIISWSSRQN